MIQPLSVLLSNDVDEAFEEKPGGGALDEEHDETNNGSSGALPINNGGEAEALRESLAVVMAKTGANEHDKTEMDAFVAQCWRKWACTCRLHTRAQVQLP